MLKQPSNMCVMSSTNDYLVYKAMGKTSMESEVSTYATQRYGSIYPRDGHPLGFS